MTAIVVVAAQGVQQWIVAGATELRVIRGGSLLLDQAFRDSLDLVAEVVGADPSERPPDDLSSWSGWWPQVVSSGQLTLLFGDDGKADEAADLLARHLRQRLAGLPLSVGVGRFPNRTSNLSGGFEQARSEALRDARQLAGTGPRIPGHVVGTLLCTICGVASRSDTPGGLCPSCKNRSDRRPRETEGWEGADVEYEMGRIGAATRSKRYAGYVAVICADGDGFGALFTQTATQGPVAIHELSGRITASGQAAVTAAITAAIEAAGEAATRGHTSAARYASSAEKTRAASRRGLPFNPVITGGDDLCLVMPADVGLAAAAALSGPHDGFTYSAGVFLCHDTFPFNVSHDLAQRLVDAAKRETRQDDEHRPHVAFRLESGAAAADAQLAAPLSASPYRRDQLGLLLEHAPALQVSGSQLRVLAEAVHMGGRLAERAWQRLVSTVEDGDCEALETLHEGIRGDDSLAGPWVRDGNGTRRSFVGDLMLVRALGGRP